MTDWDDLMEPARVALEALIRKGDEMADSIAELEAKDRGPWPNAIRAVNYRVGTKEDGSVIWAHRIEQYHDGQWAAARVYEENEGGTLKEIAQ